MLSKVNVTTSSIAYTAENEGLNSYWIVVKIDCLFNKERVNKSNFYYTRLCTGYGVASWRSPLPQLAPRHTVQGCIGGN